MVNILLLLVIIFVGILVFLYSIEFISKFQLKQRWNTIKDRYQRWKKLREFMKPSNIFAKITELEKYKNAEIESFNINCENSKTEATVHFSDGSSKTTGKVAINVKDDINANYYINNDLEGVGGLSEDFSKTFAHATYTDDDLNKDLALECFRNKFSNFETFIIENTVSKIYQTIVDDPQFPVDKINIHTLKDLYYKGYDYYRNGMKENNGYLDKLEKEFNYTTNNYLYNCSYGNLYRYKINDYTVIVRVSNVVDNIDVVIINNIQDVKKLKILK